MKHKTTVRRHKKELGGFAGAERLIRARYPGVRHNRFTGGAYSEIFVWRDQIIKYVRNDSAYMKYIIWAARHQNNPFVPKIFDLHIFKYNYAVVRMEKLDDLDDCPERCRTEYSAFRNCLIWEYDHKKRLQEFLNRGQKRYWTDLRKKFKALCAMHCEDVHEGNVMIRWVKKTPQLVLIDPVC